MGLFREKCTSCGSKISRQPGFIDRTPTKREGMCPKHGKWVICWRHKKEDVGLVYDEGYYVPDRLLVGPCYPSPGGWCPVCKQEFQESKDKFNAQYPYQADEAEAERRNAEERRQHPDPPDRMPGWIAEFRAQGYGEEAAKALAVKRSRENPIVSPSRKEWTAYDIVMERDGVERQRKLDRGEIAVCPKCGRDVLASQGIVLRHGNYDYGRQRWDDPGGVAVWKGCDGEGSQSAHKGQP